MKEKKRNMENEKYAEKILNFKKIGAIIQKNFIVLTRDKTRLIPLLMFPLFMILVLGYTTGNIPKHIETGIVIQDNSALSQSIQQSIAQNQVFTIKRVVSTEDEGKRLLDEEVIKVLIEIPPDVGKNVAEGQQQGITIIVDESDSAIAQTSKQTITSIINQLSNQISAKKIQEYQKSVDASGNSLNKYINAIPNDYSKIYQDTKASAKAISKTKTVLDNTAQLYRLSLPQPILIALTTETITEYGSNQTSNKNGTVILKNSPGYNSLAAEISVLEKTSGILDIASNNLNSAVKTAGQDAVTDAYLNDNSYQKNVIDALSHIKMFSYVKANNLLKPLIVVDQSAYGNGLHAIDFLMPSLIALIIFQSAVMGMGRAVAGEKREGSLTRVFLTPTSNITIVVGTLLFYVLFELTKTILLILFSIILFHIHIEGSLLLIALILTIYVSVCAALGMIISSRVSTEQQFMAMAMLVSIPTIFLSGAFFPVQAMPKTLQSIAFFLPVTYAGEALRDVMVKNFSLGLTATPIFVLLVFFVVIVGGALITFKRDIE